MAKNFKGSGKLIGIIVISFVVLAGGATGAWYWFMYKPEQEAIEKARLVKIAKEEARKKREEEAKQKKDQYDGLIEQADYEFDQGNWQAAHSLYSQASSIFPDQNYPQDQLVFVNTKLDELAALEAKKSSGAVETISTSTGRFYVIIASSVDGDLAMDYASKLAKEGNSMKIIEPYATNKLFHRVSIDDYDTWDQAVSASNSYTSFGGSVWVLKY